MKKKITQGKKKEETTDRNNEKEQKREWAKTTTTTKIQEGEEERQADRVAASRPSRFRVWRSVRRRDAHLLPLHRDDGLASCVIPN